MQQDKEKERHRLEKWSETRVTCGRRDCVSQEIRNSNLASLLGCKFIDLQQTMEKRSLKQCAMASGQFNKAHVCSLQHAKKCCGKLQKTCDADGERGHPHGRRDSVLATSLLPRLVCRLSAVKVPAGFFVETDNLILKFT